MRCLVTVATLLASGGCVVDSVCYNDADCPDTHLCHRPPTAPHGECRKQCTAQSDCHNPGRVCDTRPYVSGAICLDRCTGDDSCPIGWSCDVGGGACFAGECHDPGDCEPGFACGDGGYCVGPNGLDCPIDMVAIEDRFCIDVYEASRADATSSFAGSDPSVATSRPGVLPWRVASNAAALAACEAADKTLCTGVQWQVACAGPEDTAYSYGNDYEPTTCNGIDTYCRCNSGPCEGTTPCPYAHCYGTCGASRLSTDPTGSHTGCTNPYGVYDMNGNLWEHVLGGDGQSVRGGAYNCLDSEQLHRCTYVPRTWTPSAQGFRCCSSGTPR